MFNKRLNPTSQGLSVNCPPSGNNSFRTVGRTDRGLPMLSVIGDGMRGNFLTALEFYSGIGGLNFSLQECGHNARVIESFDINDVANDVYEHNFRHRPSNKNIQNLTTKYLDNLHADIWLMSPPCQPYTRLGLRKDSSDGRAQSFLQIIEKIPAMGHPPSYLLVENVVGFETSLTHTALQNALGQASFVTQEFVLSPIQFGVPYSRPRYFCLAKRSPLRFIHMALCGQLVFSPNALYLPHGEESCPVCESLELCEGMGSDSGLSNGGESLPAGEALVREIGEFLEEPLSGDFEVPSSVYERWGQAMDIVTRECRRCCCFTKSYVQFAKGTGSILVTRDEALLEGSSVTSQAAGVSSGKEGEVIWRGAPLSNLGLRFFTPREIANFHSIPPLFSFPDHVTLRQRYALLGNSLSVKVVSQLLKYLLSNG